MNNSDDKINASSAKHLKSYYYSCARAITLGTTYEHEGVGTSTLARRTSKSTLVQLRYVGYAKYVGTSKKLALNAHEYPAIKNSLDGFPSRTKTVVNTVQSQHTRPQQQHTLFRSFPHRKLINSHRHKLSLIHI